MINIEINYSSYDKHEEKIIKEIELLIEKRIKELRIIGHEVEINLEFKI